MVDSARLITRRNLKRRGRARPEKNSFDLQVTHCTNLVRYASTKLLDLKGFKNQVQLEVSVQNCLAHSSISQLSSRKAIHPNRLMLVKQRAIKNFGIVLLIHRSGSFTAVRQQRLQPTAPATPKLAIAPFTSKSRRDLAPRRLPRVGATDIRFSRSMISFSLNLKKRQKYG